MIFYHQTSAADAKAILVSGFRNGGRSHALVNFELRGVWISQEPVGMVQLNGKEPRLLEIKLPDNLDISEYELLSLSQLNDQGRLRESRTIGQDADLVLSIEPPESENQPYEILVRKNRNGQSGVAVPVRFRGERVRFE